MTRPIERRDILDYITYSERRRELLPDVLAVKRERRIHLGDYLTFLFENEDTVRYQIQEMVRVEKMVKEAEIQHELETYNELLGGEGELGCTLLIEIDDVDKRAELLKSWLDLPRHLYLRVEDGERVFARFDPRQQGSDRLSSVQYLKFDTGGRLPVAIGATHPELTDERELTDEQKRALGRDLGSP